MCERKVLTLPRDIKPLHLQNWACYPAQTISKGYSPVLLIQLFQTNDFKLLYNIVKDFELLFEILDKLRK